MVKMETQKAFLEMGKEIEEKGFMVLPDLISNHDCDHYKSILESNYEIYAPNYAKNSASGAHGLDNKSMEKKSPSRESRAFFM